jgi:hypothetical protein
LRVSVTIPPNQSAAEVRWRVNCRDWRREEAQDFPQQERREEGLEWSEGKMPSFLSLPDDVDEEMKKEAGKIS